MEIIHGRHKERLQKMLSTFNFGEQRGYGDLSELERTELETRQWRIFEDEARNILALARKHRRMLDKVNRAGTWLNRLSPFGCLQNACLAIADTGPDHETDLFRRNYHYQASLLEYMMREAGRKALRGFNATAIPEYKPRPRGLKHCLAASLPDITLLCLMGIVLFLLSYRVFVRMDVLS